MLSRRDIDRIAGVLLVLVFAAFAVFILTFVPYDIDRKQIRQDLQVMVDDDARYATSWAFNLAGGLLLVVASGGLYLVFRSYERSLALFGLVGLLAAGTAFSIATMNSFSLFFLADDFVLASGAEADALAITTRSVGLAQFAAPTTAFTLVGAGVLPIGVIMAWSKTWPRLLGWWAIINGILLLLAWTVAAPSPAGFILVAIGFISTLLFFLLLGVWLVARGSPDPASA